MVVLDRIHDNNRLLKSHSSPYHSEHARHLKNIKKSSTYISIEMHGAATLFK